MTAAPSSTTILSNAPSSPSLSAARTTSSPGSDGGHRWATVASLIASAKLNKIEPYAYLKPVLERMVDAQNTTQHDALLPWTWRPAVNH
jgi:hypothetical protein